MMEKRLIFTEKILTIEREKDIVCIQITDSYKFSDDGVWINIKNQGNLIASFKTSEVKAIYLS